MITERATAVRVRRQEIRSILLYEEIIFMTTARKIVRITKAQRISEVKHTTYILTDILRQPL